MNTRSFVRSTGFATVFVAAGLLSLTAGATAATSDGEVLKTVVSYGDLNLDRPDGITKLYQRVSQAAEQVCAPLNSRQLSLMSAWRTCKDGAVSRAIANINVPALSAYASARGKHSYRPILAARGQ